jgi:hypothetical protein
LPSVNYEPLCGACVGLCLNYDLPKAKHAWPSTNHAFGKAENILHEVNHESSRGTSFKSLLDIPNDILYTIIIFTDIIEKHVLRFNVLRFICKHLHRIVHKVAINNLKLPKYFGTYNFSDILAKVGSIELFDWLMWAGIGGMCLEYDSIDMVTRTGNLDPIKYVVKKYNLTITEQTSWQALKAERISILKWLIEERYQLNRYVLSILAKKSKF